MKRKTFRTLWIRLSILVVAALGLELATAQGVAVLEETPETRVVSHAAGETRIPANPERVAVLYPGTAEALFALGAEVAGIGTCGPLLERDYYRPFTEGVPRLGECSEPNLEAILAVQPDLILAESWMGDEDLFRQLSRIAPTVVLPESGGPFAFREQLLDLAALLGMPERGEARLAEFDAATAEARARLDEVVGEETVAVLGVNERDLRLYGALSPIAFLYEGLGLTPSPSIPRELVDGLWHRQLSLEVLPEIEADHLFLMVEDEARLSSLEGTALWRNLSAVQGGNVYPADAYSWVGGGILSREQVRQDVLEALVGESESP